MSPEQRRKFNTGVGGLFIGSGIIAWALTVYFAVSPNPPKPTPVLNKAEIDLPSCRSAIQLLGFQATLKGDKLEVSEPLSDNPKAQLEKASVASTMCKLQLESFCMGEACETPGLSFTLVKPAGVKPAAPPTTPPVRPASGGTAKK